MKKVVSLLLAAICLVGVSAAAGSKSSVTKIKVKNERQFLKALGSNRVITIAKGAKLNLSKALEDEALCNEIGMPWTDCYPEGDNGPEVVSESRSDGRQLTFLNIYDLTIEGEKNVEIVVDPRYACVMGFIGCSNIKLKNLTLGHTEEGYCEGAVIELKSCYGFTVENCDLYGCGTYGIEARGSDDVAFYRSIIRDCSYGIMAMGGCENAYFEDCDFYRNREFTLLEVIDCSAKFTRCRFAQNCGKLFPKDYPLTIEDCEIHHPRFFLIDGNDWNLVHVQKLGQNDFFEDLKPLSPRKIGPKK
ncbi:MAG: right-handed parallel beta-helix repeat-containing protein [Muribaculaceae bacterium]|nr:right-handed parallel beta-helix repeat-containing protein [Muribaculaceae bacterium]